MEFIRVTNKLAEINAGLTIAPITAIQPQIRAPYKQLILQPEGEVEASKKRIGLLDRNTSYTLSRSFLKIASEELADLVVAPEYSIHWNTIEEIGDGGACPNEGALWVLGAESINPDQISGFEVEQTAKGFQVICDAPDS